METMHAAPPAKQGARRLQVSLFSALIMMLLLAVIVGLAVKVWDLQQAQAEEMQRNAALQGEISLARKLLTLEKNIAALKTRSDEEDSEIDEAVIKATNRASRRDPGALTR